MELYWSYTGTKTYSSERSGAERSGGGGAQPLAAVSRRLGQVSGWAERRAGVLGLPAREGWKVRWKRSASPKPSPLRGGAVGCGGVAGVFGLGS